LTTLEGVARHLFEHALRKSDAASLSELVQIAQELREEIGVLFESPSRETATPLAVAGGSRPAA